MFVEILFQVMIAEGWWIEQNIVLWSHPDSDPRSGINGDSEMSNTGTNVMQLTFPAFPDCTQDPGLLIFLIQFQYVRFDILWHFSPTLG